MKKYLMGIIVAVMCCTFQVSEVSAATLKMEPLLYDATIRPGEKKKGFVDISNPASQSVAVRVSVQAFKQINDNGGLQFFEDEQISAGIIPDLTDFELGPREKIRMYFLIDGTKLPKGDVFAALFVSTVPNQESQGIAQSVRLGTILTLVNETPGARDAEIDSLHATFLQIGSAINGSYVVKNTADDKTASGFYPDVVISISPLGVNDVSKSPLVMAGRSREADFRLDVARFGLYNLTASYEESKQSKLIFVVTGYWLWLAPLIAALLAALVVWRFKFKKKSYYKAP